MAAAVLPLITLVLLCYLLTISQANFNQQFDITFGDQRAQIQNGGQQLTLSLDKFSGSGFKSKNDYLFGRIDMQIKLVAGNSAGTVTTFYLSSEGANHRRNRLRIPWKLIRRSLPYPHQRLRSGQRKQRAAILSLVRPHLRFPHLHHRLESSTNHIHGGQHTIESPQQPGIKGSSVPKQAADEDLLQPMECR